ncbi:MAG: hypothetical protein NVSMB42_07770 [Herpetosiphon sp.]
MEYPRATTIKGDTTTPGGLHILTGGTQSAEAQVKPTYRARTRRGRTNCQCAMRLEGAGNNDQNYCLRPYTYQYKGPSSIKQKGAQTYHYVFSPLVELKHSYNVTTVSQSP